MGAGHQPGGVGAEIEMVFHISHPSVGVPVQPGFEPAGFLVQLSGPCKTDEPEAQTSGFGANQFGMTFSGLHND